MTEDSRELAHQAIKRFERGESDREEFVDARGSRTRMIRDEDDPRFFRTESEIKEGEFAVTMSGMRLGPAGRPPRDYPREVPFLPFSAAVVMLMPLSGSTIVRWENPPDPAAAFADIREQLEDTGWKEVSEAGRKAVFHKNSLTRTLALFPGEERTDLVLTEETSEEES